MRNQDTSHRGNCGRLALVDQPDRQFQVWAYSVGMGRLLLRSTKNEVLRTRVDVLFQNVKAMKLATALPGLTVTEADPEQQRRIVDATGLLPDDETCFYVLVGALARTHSSAASRAPAGRGASDQMHQFGVEIPNHWRPVMKDPFAARGWSQAAADGLCRGPLDERPGWPCRVRNARHQG